MRWLDNTLRTLLFQLESEASHDRALDLLAAAQLAPGGLGALQALYGAPSQQPVELLGLRFPNRVGLAAGYDKGARAWRALGSIGFGHVEIGTVTPEPQPGNPKPRVFRLTEDTCLINRLGFPSEGAAVVRQRLDRRRPYGMVLGVNIGPNKANAGATETAAADCVSLVRTFASVADYLTVNVSSPNTPKLRELQTGAALRTLLTAVVAERDAQIADLHRQLPVLVKLSPDLSSEDLDDALGAVSEAGLDGVIATNTTLSREGATSSLRDQTGGLSGTLLTERADQFMRDLRSRAGDELPLVGVGGIMTGDDAKRRLDAGADLVQVYTGLVYGGPGLVGRIAAATA